MNRPESLADLYTQVAERKARRNRRAFVLFLVASTLLALECVYIIAH